MAMPSGKINLLFVWTGIKSKKITIRKVPLVKYNTDDYLMTGFHIFKNFANICFQLILDSHS